MQARARTVTRSKAGGSPVVGGMTTALSIRLRRRDLGGALGYRENDRRLTRPSNETEADPLLGGFFIGDYIEVFAHDRTAWVGYNANYRHVQLLFDGIPIPQQDNYLARLRV